MGAADDVKKAWTRPGANPAYHRQEQRRLRDRWPVLAQAIEKLVRETPSRQSITDEPDMREHIIEDVLLEHRRKTIGPCACGWFEPGRSHAAHVAQRITEATR